MYSHVATLDQLVRGEAVDHSPPKAGRLSDVRIYIYIYMYIYV